MFGILIFVDLANSWSNSSLTEVNIKNKMLLQHFKITFLARGRNFKNCQSLEDGSICLAQYTLICYVLHLIFALDIPKELPKVNFSAFTCYFQVFHNSYSPIILSFTDLTFFHSFIFMFKSNSRPSW